MFSMMLDMVRKSQQIFRHLIVPSRRHRLLKCSAPTTVLLISVFHPPKL